MLTNTFSSEKDFINESVRYIKEICDSCENPKIALSGGSTPQEVYKKLPKDLAEFYQVDERYIPYDNSDSNQKMIRETLNPENFHHFDTSLPISEAIEKYKQDLPEQFDLIILGVGTDGHTASLFPDSPEFTEPIAHTQTIEHPIKDRLTITFPTILKAKNILVLLKGQNKEGVIEKHPTKKLLPHRAIKVHFTP